jgi:hypothetical protein
MRASVNLILVIPRIKRLGDCPMLLHCHEIFRVVNGHWVAMIVGFASSSLCSSGLCCTVTGFANLPGPSRGVPFVQTNERRFVRSPRSRLQITPSYKRTRNHCSNKRVDDHSFVCPPTVSRFVHAFAVHSTMGNLLACSVAFGSWNYGCGLPHRRGVHVVVVRSSGSLSSSACPLAEVSPRLVMVDMVGLVIVDVV